MSTRIQMMDANAFYLNWSLSSVLQIQLTFIVCHITISNDIKHGVVQCELQNKQKGINVQIWHRIATSKMKLSLVI